MKDHRTKVRRTKKRIKNKATKDLDVKKVAERIEKNFADHIEADKESFSKIINLISTANVNLELHIKEQDERWARVEPALKNYEGVEWSGKAIGKLVGYVSLLVGLAYGVKQLWKS